MGTPPERLPLTHAVLSSVLEKPDGEKDKRTKTDLKREREKMGANSNSKEMEDIRLGGYIGLGGIYHGLWAWSVYVICWEREVEKTAMYDRDIGRYAAAETAVTLDTDAMAWILLVRTHAVPRDRWLRHGRTSTGTGYWEEMTVTVVSCTGLLISILRQVDCHDHQELVQPRIGRLENFHSSGY